MKGDSIYTPEVTAQVENKSLPTTQHCSSQLVKYLLAQIIEFKAADCCQAALYTYVLKITQYHAPLCLSAYHNLSSTFCQEAVFPCAFKGI